MDFFWQTFLDNCRFCDNQDNLREFRTARENEEYVKFIRKKQILEKSPLISDALSKVEKKKSGKSAAVSARLRAEGNTLFQKKHNDKALEKYTQSVLYAPVNGEGNELALALANRSAVLYHLKYYQLCLDDIGLALSHKYPDNLLYKVFLRQANCYARLAKAKQTDIACKTTLSVLTNAKDVTEKKQASIHKEVEDLLSQVKSLETEPPCGEPVKSLAALSHGSSDFLPQASAAVSLHYNDAQGRYLQANKDIQAGDTLIIEKPFAAVLLPDHYNNHCHHCFAKVIAPIGCEQCVKVRYCSEECRSHSWQTYHSIECPILDLLHAVGIAHLALRVVLVAGLRQLLDIRKEIIANVTGVSGVDKFGRYGNSYHVVYHLMPHSNDMLVEDLFQYSLTAALLLKVLEQSRFFKTSGKQNQLTNGDSQNANIIENGPVNNEVASEDVTYIGGLLLRHIQQLVCNAHAITEVTSRGMEQSTVETRSQERIATAIYPTASLMNHSCLPNIISSFQGDELVVRAVENIGQGGEIYNCYGPHAKRMAYAERQEALKQQYFFQCNCQECLSDGKKDFIFKALKCGECCGPLGPPEPSMTCMKCGHVSDNKSAVKVAHDAHDMFLKGQLMLERNDTKGGLKLLLQCYEMCKPIMYKHNKDLAEIQDQLARCYAEKGDYKTAISYLNLSITTTEKMFGETSVELANELHKKAEILFNAKRMDESLVVIDKAMDLFKLNYGNDHISVQELFNMKMCLLQAKTDQWMPYKQTLAHS